MELVDLPNIMSVSDTKTFRRTSVPAIRPVAWGASLHGGGADQGDGRNLKLIVCQMFLRHSLGVETLTYNNNISSIEIRFEYNYAWLK